VDIFELCYPGTWLNNTPDSKQVFVLLRRLESQLADASMGLALFQQARGQPFIPPYQRAQQRQPRVQAIERELETQIPATLTREQRIAAITDIRESADLQARREEWAAGQVPDGYEARLVFIYAHAVVFALDNISKTLGVLADMQVPPGVIAARDAYEQALPDLVHVRDSAHHTEDRVRGLDKKKRPLVLQPVDTRVISAPGGRVLAISGLADNRLGYTASDGNYREVEISAQSVAVAQAAIQQTIDAFSWHGPSETVPR
jgi:hypothetical protein